MARGSVEAKAETRIANQLNSEAPGTSLGDLASILGHIEGSDVWRNHGVVDQGTGTRFSLWVLHGRMLMIAGQTANRVARRSSSNLHYSIDCSASRNSA